MIQNGEQGLNLTYLCVTGKVNHFMGVTIFVYQKDVADMSAKSEIFVPENGGYPENSKVDVFFW